MIDPSDHFTLSLPFAQPVHACIETGSTRLVVRLEQDLIDDWIMICEWRDASGLKRQKQSPVTNYEQGLTLMSELVKKEYRGKRRAGYGRRAGDRKKTASLSSMAKHVTAFYCKHADQSVLAGDGGRVAVVPA